MTTNRAGLWLEPDMLLEGSSHCPCVAWKYMYMYSFLGPTSVWVGDMTMSGWKPTISLIHPPTHLRLKITSSAPLLRWRSYPRNLLSLCMTNTATLPKLMRRDCTCLLGSKDPMILFLQLVHLSFSMLDDLYSKLLAYGANQQNVQCNLKVLATEAGRKRVKSGKFLVNPPTHCSVLPAADKMSLHRWMSGTMQVLSLHPEVHTLKSKTMIQTKFKQVTSVCSSTYIMLLS